MKVKIFSDLTDTSPGLGRSQPLNIKSKGKGFKSSLVVNIKYYHQIKYYSFVNNLLNECKWVFTKYDPSGWALGTLLVSGWRVSEISRMLEISFKIICNKMRWPVWLLWSGLTCHSHHAAPRWARRNTGIRNNYQITFHTRRRSECRMQV